MRFGWERWFCVSFGSFLLVEVCDDKVAAKGEVAATEGVGTVFFFSDDFLEPSMHILQLFE